MPLKEASYFDAPRLIWPFSYPFYPWHLLLLCPLFFQKLYMLCFSSVPHLSRNWGIRRGRATERSFPQLHPLQPALGLAKWSLKFNDCIKPSLLPWFVVLETKRGTDEPLPTSLCQVNAHRHCPINHSSCSELGCLENDPSVLSHTATSHWAEVACK